MFPAFKRYIQSICKGPLLASTVHNAILNNGERCSVGQPETPQLWEQLKEICGEQEARRLVKDWIDKPYSLKGK
jgi:hypothetical protein